MVFPTLSINPASLFMILASAALLILIIDFWIGVKRTEERSKKRQEELGRERRRNDETSQQLAIQKEILGFWARGWDYFSEQSGKKSRGRCDGGS